uniref:Uncharacterized protein n=1 Tax=Arundo donax TaxID=35708 RepID=A0A0A8Z3A9_ARUDO
MEHWQHLAKVSVISKRQWSMERCTRISSVSLLCWVIVTIL